MYPPVVDFWFIQSVSQQGATEYSGEIRGHYNPDDNVLPNGDLTIIEKRRRILECFSGTCFTKFYRFYPI